jgi:predicted dinucleotide-binding enzyme
MQIGIIGAGNIGGTLTRRLRQLGHDVEVANSRGPETLRDLATETGATAVTAAQAAQGKELVVVTIPEARIPDLPNGLLTESHDGAEPHYTTVVVDTGNYYPRQRDGRIAAIEGGLPESRWVETQIDHPVVKAFNNIIFDHLMHGGKAAGAPDRIALPVSGDDPAAKQIVMRLIDELGFDAVDTGDLDESWRQQPGSPVYTTDLAKDGLVRGLADASPNRAPEWSATDQSPGTFTDPR